MTPDPLNFAGMTLDTPRLMGVVNVTPDSFSDGGDFLDPQAAIDHGRKLVDDGAHILDIGGESTRPGAAEVPVAQEIERVVPIVAALRAAGVRVPLSIDTRKSAVARAALAEGADMINDVSDLISFEIRDRDACAKFTKFDDFYGYVVYEIPGGTRQISVSGPTVHEC